MKVLQLFSTSESVDTVIRQMGFDVFDHLDKDYSDWEPGQFDIIWASIPKINKSLPFALDVVGEVVLQVLEIIEYFNPKYCVIEGADRFEDKHYCHGLPSRVVDYLAYDVRCNKHEVVFTNISKWKPKVFLSDGKNRLYTESDQHIVPDELVYDILNCIRRN